MDLFDSAVFDSAVFDTGDAQTLHGGVTRKRRGGGRDLDKLEQEREERRLARLKKKLEQAQQAAEKQADVVLQAEEKVSASVMALVEPVHHAQNEASKQAIRLQAQETARVAAEKALAEAIALQTQLDDEAAQAFLAYLMA